MVARCLFQKVWPGLGREPYCTASSIHVLSADISSHLGKWSADLRHVASGNDDSGLGGDER